ncbi:unnamed protein product [Bursaphelenchus okinawaensis]|uniref:Endonuclease/exonuclease/phosphatase domain-containing protein n=1 Tax=Bursaphelenchus okinawaensis TaxID=465554 RepID=A0A811L7R3_9BILA|nr:unnamed protein product [Bursaphelenchus okinawaensis]CAG9118240.1 unnamed protein product [Bursaphelenchus okinawaensis]
MVAHRRTLMASRLPNSTEVVETTKNNGKMELRIGTLNCHGLRTDERKLELLEELEKVNINILGLTETRSTGKGCDSINGQWLYYYSGHNSEVGGSGRENAGVGILLPKIMEKMVIGTRFYDERIMEMELEVGRRRISLVVAYAPHSGKTVEGYNQFIDKVTDLIQLVKMDGVRTKKLLLAGDWNGNVGFKQDDAEKLGQYGYGARNRNGQLLMDFAVEQNLWVLNTCFRKRMGRRWTWKLAGARNPTKVMIDMFLSEDLGWIRDVRAMVMGFSDHKLVMAKLEVMAMVGRNGTVNKKVGDRRKLKVVLANKRQDLNRIDDFGALVEEQKVIFNECAKSKEVSAKFGPSTIEWMRIRYEKRMLYNEGEIEKRGDEKH